MDFHALSSLRSLCGLAVYPEVAEATEGPSRRPFISVFSLLPFSFLLLTCPIWFRLRRAVDDSSETAPHSSGRFPLDAAAAKMSFALAASTPPLRARHLIRLLQKSQSLSSRSRACPERSRRAVGEGSAVRKKPRKMQIPRPDPSGPGMTV